MKYQVGTVTIGQAPRVDITPDLKTIIGDGIEIVEAGALDGLTKKDIEKFGNFIYKDYNLNKIGLNRKYEKFIKMFYAQ